MGEGGPTRDGRLSRRRVWSATGYSFYVTSSWLAVQSNGHTVAYNEAASTQPNASLVTNQKQQRIAQGLAQAATNTNRAHDHGSVANFPPPSPHAIAEPAIPIGPIAMTQSSAWMAGWYPQTMNEVLVMGGFEQSKSPQGILDVQVLNQPDAPWNGEFLAPGNTGAITIANIKGPIVQWASASGTSGSFNLASQQWATP